MRLLRLAAVEIVLFVLAVLVLAGLYRWHLRPARPPEASVVTASVTPGVGSEATAEAVPDHSEALPEESEAPVTQTTPYPPIDPKRLLSREVKVQDYEVKLGENYWSVAKKFNIDVPTLIGANPEMPFVSRVKQTLLVTDHKGVLHAVAKGEDLKAIAAHYDVKVEDIKKSNSLPWWHSLREGDVLFLAGVKPFRMNEQWRDYFSKRGMFGMPFSTWGRGWSSRFGYRSDPITGEKRLHKGMDFRAKYGVDVFASASGTVIFAGVSGGYGNLIQIKHPNDYITFYGHLSQIFVRQGQKVHRGQRIGKVGATGRVTGPHLHFEIRKNGKAINPLPLI
jgi:LysM repeat protein